MALPVKRRGVEDAAPYVQYAMVQWDIGAAR